MLRIVVAALLLANFLPSGVDAAPRRHHRSHHHRHSRNHARRASHQHSR